MFNIFTFLPLLFFIITSYYFNSKKLSYTKRYVFLISLFEAIFSYLLVYFLFFEGFISTFGQLLLLILILLIIGYIHFYMERNLDRDWDLQIETIKNTIVLFTTTILPMYVFLTIFRYLEPYMQISLSILVTIVIFTLSLIAKRIFAPIFERLAAYISECGATKYILLWVSICLIVISVILFDLPTNKVSKQLNLSNNVSFLTFDDFPTNLKNSFETKEIIKIDMNYNIESKITDYFYDNNYVYLYTQMDTLIVYDLTKNQVVYEANFGNTTTKNIVDTEIYNKFTYYNDQLILLGYNGTYLITNENAMKISDISVYNASKYYHNNELYYLNKKTNTLYEIYKFNNNKLILNETIDLHNTNYDNLVVISENLFYEDKVQYALYNDLSKKYDKNDGFPIYDKDKQIMYYTLTNKYPNHIADDTLYQRVDENGEEKNIKIEKSHNSKGIIIKDYLYFTEDDSNRIEIIYNDFEIYSIYNHLKLQPFWLGKKFYNSYIGNYQEKDNNLEFLQVDQNKEHIVITIQQLEERNVNLNLPFYTHYSIGIFIPIIIAFFIPLTNYRELVTYLSFETIIKKKR